MPPILFYNLGPPPYNTGTIYQLVATPNGWKLLNRSGQLFTPRGLYQFARHGGRLRVSKHGEHTHITGGGPVEYAGEVRFSYNRRSRGRLLWWSNGSGHYKPPAEHAAQAGLPMASFVPEQLTP